MSLRHVENMRLEGSVNSWTPEQRMLVFPNVTGRIVQYMNFTRGVWRTPRAWPQSIFRYDGEDRL